MKRNNDRFRPLKKIRGTELTVYRTDLAWAAVIAFISWLCLEMFYRMIINYNDKYMSDMHFYAVTNVTEIEEHDRFLGFFFQWLYDINQSTMEINIYLAAVIGAIMILNFAVIRYYLRDDGALGSVPRPAAQLFSVAALFMGPMYIPVIHEWYYRKSFEAFAWHSPTQQSMTLFSLIATLCFFRMYLRYEEQGVSPLWWTATACTVFLSAFTKPSFMFDMFIALVILFIIELIRGGSKGFGRRFARLFIMGCTLVPSGLYTLWLQTREFYDASAAGEEEHHIVFGLAHLADEGHIIIGFVCSMAFAIVVFAVNHGRFRDRKYLFALLMFIAGVLQWALITESGKRGSYGNFTWGRVYATYFMTLVSTVVATENYYQKYGIFGGDKTKRTIYFAVLAVLFALSVASQLQYFRLILTGHGYMR